MLKGIIAALAVVLAMPAFGQSLTSGPPQCKPREAILEILSERYGESRRSVAISGAVIVEVFVNDETGSWTFLTTNTFGISCVMAGGEEWQETDDQLTPTGMKV